MKAKIGRRITTDTIYRHSFDLNSIVQVSTISLDQCNTRSDYQKMCCKVLFQVHLISTYRPGWSLVGQTSKKRNAVFEICCRTWYDDDDDVDDLRLITIRSKTPVVRYYLNAEYTIMDNRTSCSSIYSWSDTPPVL